MGTKKIPQQRKHKASGRAYINDPGLGREVYLGPWKSEEANRNYDRWLREFLQRPSPTALPGLLVSVGTLLDGFMTHAESYYRKRGKPTSEVANYQQVVKRLRALYFTIRAEDFGPTQFKVVRQKMVDDGQARTTANSHAARIVRIWRWGVEHELVSPDCLAKLAAVKALAEGRTAAKETDDVLPVSKELVDATLPHLPLLVQDAVRVQLAGGMRPSEALALRPLDIDRSGKTWRYGVTGDWNKTEHRGRGREVWIGPTARAVLAPRIEASLAATPGGSGWLFLGRRPGTHFAETSYRGAIRDACLTHKLEHWHPSQLRHTMATAIRAKYGSEAASTVLGHADLRTTEIYAERDSELAKKIAEDMG